MKRPFNWTALIALLVGVALIVALVFGVLRYVNKEPGTKTGNSKGSTSQTQQQATTQKPKAKTPEVKKPKPAPDTSSHYR
jgi:uncharacterized iron-regulated membrane protein